MGGKFVITFKENTVLHFKDEEIEVQESYMICFPPQILH